MTLTWKCLQLAYLLCVVFMIFCTSPQQVLRTDMNLVYEIEFARFLWWGDEIQLPMIQQWLFKLVLDSYSLLWKPINIHNEEFTLFATKRVWVFNDILLLISHMSIYHARIFIPKHNRPLWMWCSMVSTQTITHVYKGSFYLWHTHHVPIFDWHYKLDTYG